MWKWQQGDMSINTRVESGRESVRLPAQPSQEEGCQGHLSGSHRTHLTRDDQTVLEVDIRFFCGEKLRESVPLML